MVNSRHQAAVDRPPPIVSEHLLSSFRGKTVWITGGGGGIGTAIACFLAHCGVGTIVLIDRNETALFYGYDTVCRCVETVGADTRVFVSLHDVRHGLPTKRPEVPSFVFHCAAYKHVPMLEDEALQAFDNNVEATVSVASHPMFRDGSCRLVHISTDKAIAPSCVMGRTKRIAELAIHSISKDMGIDASVVRLVNVLGTPCSVSEIWERQAAIGLPLTITDPTMRRYWMTGAEAGYAACIAALAHRIRTYAPTIIFQAGPEIEVETMCERLGWGAHEKEIIGQREGERNYETLFRWYETPMPLFLSKFKEPMLDYVDHQYEDPMNELDFEHWLNFLRNIESDKIMGEALQDVAWKCEKILGQTCQTSTPCPSK